jgi:hypothetical protein
MRASSCADKSPVFGKKPGTRPIAALNAVQQKLSKDAGSKSYGAFCFEIVASMSRAAA